MNRKLIVLGLAIVLAISLVVPSLAETTNVSPRVSNALSQRAIAKARTALRVSRQAKRQSRAAEELAQSAAAGAAAAQGAVQAARIQSGLAAAGVPTEATESFVPLAGGPSVTVTVPASGLIEVWAQVTMSEAGSVSLYEDGHQMPGQSRFCSELKGEGALFTASGFVAEDFPLTLGTPATLPFCGTDGPPSPVLFQTSPGQHTYELRYASCGCSPEPVTFSNRRLNVAARP